MTRISDGRTPSAYARTSKRFFRVLRHCGYIGLLVLTPIAGPAFAQFMPGQEGAVRIPAIPAPPKQPAALIEEISGPVNGLQEMDYVTAGTVLILEPRQRIVLDYLASCTRETVSGGSITIGDQQSTVRGGHIERQHVTCPGQALQLAAYQAQVAAIMPIRSINQSTTLPIPLATASTLVTVGGTSPVLLLSAVATVQIEDLGGGAPPIIVKPVVIRAPAGADHRKQGYMLDLVDENIRLFPGGLYRATQGEKHVDFLVTSTAANGRLPLMSRLLPL